MEGLGSGLEGELSLVARARRHTRWADHAPHPGVKRSPCVVSGPRDPAVAGVGCGVRGVGQDQGEHET